MALFEEIINIALNTSDWKPVVTEKQCKSVTAKTRASEAWLISANANGTAYWSVAGATEFEYEFAVPEKGTMFYVQASSTADILEVLFE